MVSYKKWAQFKEAIELQNEAARALLQLRNGIIRSLQNAIPETEKNNSNCCVMVSLEELCTVRSFSPDDYLIKTQVSLIIDNLTRCKTAADLQDTVRRLEADGKVLNGTRFLKLSPSVQSVLRQYVVPAGLETRIPLIG